MQKHFFYLTLIFTLLFSSCGSKEIKNEQEPPREEKKFFIPVTEIILGQLAELDSLPITPLKIITVDGKTDSIWMKREDVRIWASPFLTPRIDTLNLRNLFSQKSFLDQTINAFTFSYDAQGRLPDTMQLRRWDVYVDPVKQAVNRIYIVKEQKIEGKTQTLQLTWKPGSWARITIIPDGVNDLKLVKEEKVIWNFDE